MTYDEQETRFFLIAKLPNPAPRWLFYRVESAVCGAPPVRDGQGQAIGLDWIEEKLR